MSAPSISMSRWIACGLGLALAAGAGDVQAQAPVVLVCSMTLPSGPTPGSVKPAIREERVFRIGRGSFEEWRPAERKYGPNLCEAYGCSANAQRTEGAISSASVSYTIGVDHKTGAGYWRSVGASGRAETQGDCHETPDPSIGAAKR
jgi:hypothetical protein